MPKALALLAVAVATAAAALSPSVATAATPCWKKVINDWSDHNGVIQGHYSAHCLRQAIKHTPEDLRDYTSILDDISALLYDAGGSSEGGNGTGGDTSVTGMGRKNPAPPGEQELKRRAEQAVPAAGTKASIPDSSRSIPLPLLLLGGIALASALAAAAPPLLKRVRARFPRLRPAAGSVRPPS